MNLSYLISLKYPTALLHEYKIQDDGYGEYIAEWNVPNEIKPTNEQITEWQNDSYLQQQYTFSMNEIANKEIYEQLNQLDIKSVRALRTNDTDRLALIESQAISLRSKLLPTG